LRISVPRSVGGRHESQVRPHRAALLEAVGILQGKHEGQRCKRPNPLDLSQELRFGIMCFRDLLQFALVVADTLCERADLLEDGPKSRPKRLRYVLCSSLVEAHRWALGQAGSEGFDRSAHVVYELRAATDQYLMATLLEYPTCPRRVGASLYCDAHGLLGGEASSEGLWGGAQPTLLDHLAAF
jgi:hypothetical protein